MRAWCFGRLPHLIAEFSPWRRRIGTIALTLIVAVQAACSTVPPKSAGRDYRPGRQLAVVAVDQPPEITLEGFPQDKGTGAVATAGYTFGACLGGIGHSSCSGSICGPGLILMLGVCSVASVVGGVVGAVKTPSAEASQGVRSNLAASSNLQAAQDALRQEVVSVAIANGAYIVDLTDEQAAQAVHSGNYKTLAGMGIDDVLEVKLVKVSMEGADANKPLTGYMKTHVRLIGTSDNREKTSVDYLFNGPSLPLAEWTANDGARLLDMLRTGYEALGVQIYEQVFMRYPFPDQHLHTPRLFVTHYGLAPIYPIYKSLALPVVDSVQPTLEWQSFPRATDVEADRETMARISKVRYDLIVADPDAEDTVRVVYRRDGLREPKHKITTALQWGQTYRWTVRARFELNGEERVTEWSSDWRPGQINGVPRNQVSPPAWVSSFFFKVE